MTLPSFTFPVAKEKEHSVQLLYKFFCNNLYLGQWELARACISRLHVEKQLISTEIREVLLDIVEYPYNRSIGQNEVGSSHQLAWLCLQECKRLCFEDIKEEKEYASVEKSCEFRLLLVEACVDTSEQVLKDLCLYQKAVCQAYEDVATNQPLSLSSDLLKLLLDKLLDNPLLGHSLINSIYARSKHSQYKKNNENLKGLYIKSVNVLLDRISNSHQSNIQERTAKVDKIYRILSLYDPDAQQYQNYLSIRELFAKIYEVSVADNSLIDRNKVLSVLIGRKSNYLVEEFCKVEYDLEHQYLLSTASIQQSDDLPDEQKCLLSLIRQPEKKDLMRILFLMCLKKEQHILKVVVDTCIALIKSSQFDALKVVLEPVEFQPLKPLLLLYGWSFCLSCQTAKELLDVLWTEESSCFHPALQVGCSKLAYQIDLIKWCLDKTKPLISEVSFSNHHQRAADMFIGLENHSVLYVLHQSTRIASLNQKEALDILQKSPLENEKFVDRKNKVKTVTFVETKEEHSIEESTNQPSEINIERWRDISIFSGYCAIKNVMDAIYFCVDYYDSKLTAPIKKKGYRSHSLLSNSENSSIQGPTNDANSINFQEVYTKNVMEKLNVSRDYLLKLQPLTYRVEILQDIYSLLFVTHECIQETAFYDDLDSEEDDREEFNGRNKTHETSGQYLLSEDSLTSPEATSPAVGKDFNENKNVETEGVILNGSYDEPFMENKKQNRKSAATKQNDNDYNIKRQRTRSEILLQSKKDKGGNRMEVGDNFASENGSTFSTDSSFGLTSVGFLNNEYLVRDILDMLKNALVDLEGALFQVRGQSTEKNKLTRKPSSNQVCSIDVSMEESLTDIVQCGVTKETLSTKMGLLRQYIHEANWKFQLVCHDKIPKKPGEVLLEPVTVLKETFEEEICVDLIGPKERRRKFSYSSPKTTSPIHHLESESQGGGSGSDRSGRKSGRKRSRSRGHNISKTKFPAGIISLMLSSPDTLLTMCLQRCNYNQAAQVTKLQKLDDRPEATEVKFAQQYSAAVRKLLSLNIGSQKNVPSKPGQLSMKALGSVAAAGVATVSVSSVADELLSISKLPKIPQPKCKTVHTPRLDCCFQQENCSSMILFDLLCIGCRSWEMCNNMIDSIKSKRITHDKVDNKKTLRHVSDKGDKVSSRMKDIWDVTDLFEVLLQQGADIDGSQKQFSIKNVLLTFYKHSIQALLKTATIPLYPEYCEAYARLLTDLKVSIDKVEHVFQVYGKLPAEGLIHKLDKTGLYTSPNSKISPKSSPSKTGDPTDKPVIHIAMKGLIGVLQQDLPPGGLVKLFTRSCNKDLIVNKDYLQNLYDHLKGLAMVVAESEASSKENMAIPKNYFKMLEEGPISTIGKLMFSKKIPPSKLERVAKKLSLNLNHIIVHCCCPKIPSKRLPALMSGFCLSKITDHSSHMVLNMSVSNQYEAVPASTNPELVVREIMTKLVFLMKDIAKENNARGLFDISSAIMLMKSPEFAEIIVSTGRLYNVDLDQLNTKDDKVSFFGNLQNLMFIHMCMFIVDDVMKRKEEDLDVGGHNSEMVYTEMKPIYQLQYLNMFSYHVGQMGIISLFDLKYLVNRNGLVPSLEWNGLLKDTVLELDTDDPWCKYCPPPDPRLLFVTTMCSTVSPAIQVLDPELLKSQLQMAMRDYLETSVVTHVNNREVIVPELLTLYKQDFSHQQMDEFSPADEGFIHMIAGQVTGDKQTSIQELLQIDRVHSYSGENIDETGRKELPFKVEIYSTKGEFLVAFDNTHLQQGIMKTKGHKRNVSLPKNIDLSYSKSVTSSTSSFGRYAPRYSLTPMTLEYVKSDCPLVATLISLVCEDDLDEIEDQLTEDYFARDESLRSRTPSEISLVDIKSYRYQRLTDDYPKLKRHLQNYIVPIAGSLDFNIVRSGDPVLKLITSAISDKLKACMLSLHCSQPFSEVVMSLFNALAMESKWAEILKVLQSFPSTELQYNNGYKALMELSLRFIIYHYLSISSLPDKHSADSIANCLMNICDRNKACHMLLTIYKKLPLDVVQDLFNSFYNESIHQQLRSAVVKKIKEIDLFSRITECAKTVQVRSSMSSDFLNVEDKGDYYSMLERFMDWRNLFTVISPDEVLTVLLKAKDYDTAKKWCYLNNFTKDKFMTVSERQLLHLLNGKGDDTSRAFIVLDDLRNEDCEMCFEICDQLLGSLNHQQEVLFIVDYALKYLTIPDGKLEEYELLKIGSKAILCLPRSLQEEYTHLVKCPNLLLEQLLMNMKIDLAGKVYSSICSELNKDNPAVMLDRDIFNGLITKYAKKALDFTVVMVPIIEKDRSQSQMSTASSDKLESDLSVTPTKRSFTESVRGNRRSVDVTASPRASLSVPSGKLLAGKRSKTEPERFVMPEVPPSQDKWQPDNSTETCMVCKVEKFSMFNRRHHCRRCGRVVCGTCSSKTSLVNNISVRTCDDCYQQINGNSIQEVEEEMYGSRGDNPSDSSLSRTLSPGMLLPVTDERFSMAEAIHHTQILWKLEADDETNEFTREDFYFEQAPSTSLCLSILGLHDDTKLCGNLVLDLCDDLSKHLRPIAPGIPNPEVDYSLLLSMIKTLLFHAKIIFTKSKKGGDGIAQCDVYQSRIDLLSELVNDNFTDLPSLQELTKPDIVMRLRDNLIKDERLKLAVNVSTKCGLDPTGVWAEWGMNCLQSGEFQAAREKFSRCLKPPLDRNMIQSQPSKIIADIIDCLEAMPSTGQGELQLLVSASSTESIKHLLSASMNFTEQTATDSVPFQECLYYLKTYAPFNIIIDFYRRNGYWMKAVQYVLDHKCCSDVFVEALLIPAIRSGEWGKLVDQIVLIDPSLEKWNYHLKSICKYLLKQKLHYILYEFQLIMKDYVRAAMTCITCFYQRGAESYLDLADRISYLYKAHQHLQSYLDPSQWGSVSRPYPQTGSWGKSGETNTDAGVLVQSEEQVGRHLKMIAIQIEVTKFLHHCLKNTESEAAAIATQYIAKSKTSQLPTMFGSNKTRTDLVSMILLSSNDIPSAFDLGLRIVKECKLGGQAIYTHSARDMAKHQRYDHIRQLFDCLEKAKLGEDDFIDEIIGACILVVADNPNEAKEAENLIKLLRKDSNKINAFILCGKLRSAYLMAVKAERVEDVQRIAGAAQRMGQTAVKNICNKWLEQRKEKAVK